MTPGDLTHLNRPRLLRNKSRYRVYQKTYHKTVNTYEDVRNRKNGKCYSFVGIKYVEELSYNWVGT